MDGEHEAGEVASTCQTRCCVVGAGPAGAVLSLLLARDGVPVTLLESHPDFDRDFRGDTVHPPTLELLDRLGLSDRLHALPHGKVRTLRLRTKMQTYTLADLGRLGTQFPYVMMLPQSKLLELLTEEAQKYPDFRLVMRANVQRLVEEDGAVRGVRYRDPEGRWHEVRADLTVAADGRFSKLRHLAGIEPVKTAPPMDVVWFRLPKGPADPAESAELHVGGGRFAVTLDRGDQWQIGYVILKGSFAAVKAAGVAAMGQGLAELVPWLADRVGNLHDWSQVAVLNVESSRVERWYKPGLLLIGDAAHVMSPVGGVGINVAVQDAVTAAEILAVPLKRGTVTTHELQRVQVWREGAVKLVQRVQRVIQERIAAPGLDAEHEFRPPWWLRLILKVRGLRNIPARILAFGAVPGADWTPPRDKPLHLQSTADVWVPMLGIPAFGGILLTVPLVSTTVDGGWWGAAAVVLITVAFFEFGGLFMAVPGLEELRQRGAWLPPGYHRYPILVAVAVPLAAMAVSAALMLAGGSVFTRLIE